MNRNKRKHAYFMSNFILFISITAIIFVNCIVPTSSSGFNLGDMLTKAQSGLSGAASNISKAVTGISQSLSNVTDSVMMPPENTSGVDSGTVNAGTNMDGRDLRRDEFNEKMNANAADREKRSATFEQKSRDLAEIDSYIAALPPWSPQDFEDLILNVGDPAPDFNASSSNGYFSLNDLIGNWSFLFFYNTNTLAENKYTITRFDYLTNHINKFCLEAKVLLITKNTEFNDITGKTGESYNKPGELIYLYDNDLSVAKAFGADYYRLFNALNTRPRKKFLLEKENVPSHLKFDLEKTKSEVANYELDASKYDFAEKIVIINPSGQIAFDSYSCVDASKLVYKNSDGSARCTDPKSSVYLDNYIPYVNSFIENAAAFMLSKYNDYFQSISDDISVETLGGYRSMRWGTSRRDVINHLWLNNVDLYFSNIAPDKRSVWVEHQGLDGVVINTNNYAGVDFKRLYSHYLTVEISDDDNLNPLKLYKFERNIDLFQENKLNADKMRKLKLLARAAGFNDKVLTYRLPDSASEDDDSTVYLFQNDMLRGAAYILSQENESSRADLLLNSLQEKYGELMISDTVAWQDNADILTGINFKTRFAQMSFTNEFGALTVLIDQELYPAGYRDAHIKQTVMQGLKESKINVPVNQLPSDTLAKITKSAEAIVDRVGIRDGMKSAVLGVVFYDYDGINRHNDDVAAAAFTADQEKRMQKEKEHQKEIEKMMNAL